MAIQQSAEDYLETILILTHSGMRVKSIDVAAEMNFSRASVSTAMKHLREEGMILVGEHGIITLTDAGRKIAEEVYHRHRLLTEFLMAIGVNRETAVEDACRMEHVISQKTSEMLAVYFQRLKREARRTAPAAAPGSAGS